MDLAGEGFILSEKGSGTRCSVKGIFRKRAVVPPLPIDTIVYVYVI